MFGRRTTPFGSKPPSPPSGGGIEPFPVDKMDRALEAAMFLLTSALEKAGEDVGRLGVHGPVPPNVGPMLADCTTYRAPPNGTPTYLALGLTRDFRQFLYPPHCRMFLILNNVGIAEDPAMAGNLDAVARSQFKAPLLDSALMRVWVRHILPTGEAMANGGEGLPEVHQRLMRELVAVAETMPRSWGMAPGEHVQDFAAGFPGTIGKPLEADTPRMNGLPVTPFIEQTLLNFLADLQARGLTNR